jgi:6-phosphogluconate dehydrogenase
VWGYEVGFNMMIGGPESAFRRVEPVLEALAPPDGYARVGGHGAGHFVKMVHNAVEYAMLQAIGEGFELLHSSEFGLDMGQIARLWNNGSVIRSWLLELTGDAFESQGNELAAIGAHVDDSGTGRWTVDFALENAVPIPAIATSLFQRFESRIERRFAYQVIAALRQEFGGHAVEEVRSSVAEEVR